MERHKTALAQVMADKTDSFVQSVQQTVDELGKTLASEAVQSLQAAFVAQHEAMVKNASALAKHKPNMLWLSAIAAVSALVNVAVFVALFLLSRLNQ